MAEEMTETTNHQIPLIMDDDPVGVEMINRGLLRIEDVMGSGGSSENLGSSEEVEVFNAALTHRNTFRGKNLGTSFTAAQKEAIQNGTFEDLYVGDYWKMRYTWRIADIDYYLHTGSTELTRHHLIVVPDECCYMAGMHSSNTTTNGYYNSSLKQSGLNTAMGSFNNDFNSSSVPYRDYFTTKSTSGRASSASEYISNIDILSEKMVYGCSIFQAVNSNQTIPTIYTYSKSQLKLFELHPKFIISTYNGNQYHWWLRDIANAACFTCVLSNGQVAFSNATGFYGVRPYILLG